MDKKNVIKWVFLAALILGSMAIIWPPKDKIPLGLDLAGGLSFTVEIKESAIREQILKESPDLTPAQVESRLDPAMSEAQKRALEVIRNRVDGMGIAEPIIYPEQKSRIVVQLPGISPSKVAEATRSLQSAAYLEFRLVHADNVALIQKLFQGGKAPPGYEIESLEYRGREQEFFVRNEAVKEEDVTDESREAMARFQAPFGYELMLERETIGNRKAYRPYFVSRKAELDGTKLEKATVDYRGIAEPVVAISFNKEGTYTFRRLTTDFAPNGPRNSNKNVGRQLAIILDKTLYSAPTINEPIPSGSAEISGNFTAEEAHYLANVLKAGSLPAPVKIIEKLMVSPSLGEDAVQSGVKASIIGLLAIFVCMLLYYRVTGLVANITLLCNMILLPLGMLFVAGTLGVFVAEARAGGKVALPVLTLPGIAGIALTIGMAVDANVLIFERIREEFRAGKTLAASIAAGFERAFSAIFDSNITTILTALILFVFGSGPIRGYAVTLSAGLIVSLYTAVVVGRMILDAIAQKTSNPAALKMTSLVPATNIDFISKGKFATTFSIVVIVASMAWIGINIWKDQTRVFGMDFTGGTSVTLAFEKEVSVGEVQTALEKDGIVQPFVQYQAEAASTAARNTLLVRASTLSEGATDERIGQALTTAFPAAGFRVLQSNVVGPQVGGELKGKAVWAMLLSMVVMILYISYRFEFGFALGAVLALVHDALFTIGVVFLLGKQINLTVVAAIMTIIGYSVNDTIVIFDRIREDIKLVRGKSFIELCNLSINQTLSRTLLTSAFTSLAVVSLCLFGGGAINDFAVTMLVGMFVGTYSTVFIATPIVLAWYNYKTPEFSRK
jgi:SecD/SecF fusion protein